MPAPAARIDIKEMAAAVGAGEGNRIVFRMSAETSNSFRAREREPFSIFSAATVLIEATDKTSRKKTFELAALSGNVIWFIAAEPETTKLISGWAEAD